MSSPNTKPKIQISPIFYNETLHQKSLQYWSIARIWNGVDPSPLSVGDAISTANEIRTDVNPSRPVAVLTGKLLENIVMHGSKSRMLKWLKQNQANQDAPAKVTII